MKHAGRIALLLALGVGGAVAGWWVATRQATVPPALVRATLLDTPRPLPAIGLVDQDGNAFGRDRLAGQWTLMFFGFTSCPDVCPSTLATLASVRRQLADLPAAARPGVLLVTVDPARDTPARLAPYVRQFDPEFQAVTGDPEALADFNTRMGVAVMAGVPEDDGNYGVDHTAAIFLIDPAAALAAVFGSPHQAEVIAADFRGIVASRR